MKKKIMLIAGCSHASGSEIDGTEDGTYNRQHSFGNQLAIKMGYEPINIAQSGGANATTARSILRWFDNNYNPDEMEVFAVVAWTESVRLEAPSSRKIWYEGGNYAFDWKDQSSNHFYRINLGWEGNSAEEKEVIKYFHKFIIENNTVVEIMGANLVLQIQYFLNMHKVPYVMCNTMHMFTLPNTHLEIYTDLIDKRKYMDWDNNDEAFFWKYRNAGYTNSKAKYWHHDEIPHQLYAEKLYNFIETTDVYNKLVQED